MANRCTHITKSILFYLAVAGAVTLTGISSYAIINRLLRHLIKDKDYLKDLENKSKLSKALYRLKHSKLIIISEKEDEKFLVELTKRGRKKVREIQLDDLKITKPKKWDKIWRIVIFDIPDKKKNVREALRKKLVDLGFYQLQKSVWVHAFPCKNEIEFIVELFQAYPYVQMVEATKIQNDIGLRKHFHLL